MLEIVNSSKKDASPKIVWRNPRQARSGRRRHSFQAAGERALYVVQEFVGDTWSGHWATISGLEVVVGGRAA
jgi:hypothetical protein